MSESGTLGQRGSGRPWEGSALDARGPLLLVLGGSRFKVACGFFCLALDRLIRSEEGVSCLSFVHTFTAFSAFVHRAL